MPFEDHFGPLRGVLNTRKKEVILSLVGWYIVSSHQITLLKNFNRLFKRIPILLNKREIFTQLRY